ncbi:MAG: PD-(D/E)XK nuclease family protein [Nitrosomonas sp.]|nr:PD-(D/E)XK nuclease family protein [Nitrosomonas sp.]
MLHASTLQFHFLSQEDLFKRLNTSVTAATVVTPNRRLAQALVNAFNLHQLDRQLVVWETPDILPLAAFFERIYLNTLYSNQGAELPLLLNAVQAHVLWEKVIQSDETGGLLLNITQAARLALEAWQLLHDWQLSNNFGQYPLNEDSIAFRSWSGTYRKHLVENNLTDLACLGDLIRTLCAQGWIEGPDELFCFGFDHFTPQQIAVLNALKASGSSIALIQSPVIDREPDGDKDTYAARRVCYTDVEDEIYHAAVWARSRLEADPSVSIGIIVPALTQRRSMLQRVFSNVMQPDVCAALSQPYQHSVSRLPFNISLGLPLLDYPLVDTALTILALVSQAVTYDRISDLLRSPFIGGSDVEINDRALLDQKLRRHAAPNLTLEQLVLLLQILSDDKRQESRSETGCPVLIKNFSMLLTFCQCDLPQKARHNDYAELMLSILQIVGFPGERTLDSREYQTLQKLHEIVAELATLDRIIPQTGFAGALRRLNHIASNTLFQPQTPLVPIQILGILEATGLKFDHLWVMGLSDEQWPLRPRTNPFIPYALQQKSGMPMGSVTEIFSFSQRITDRWMNSADEVILSHPKFSDSFDALEILSSPLIRSIPESSVELPRYQSHRDLIVQTVRLEHVVDDRASSMTKYNAGGGVAVIKDYAACPFRAWARHRMAVDTVDTPHVGLDAMERGILVHQVLASVWNKFKTKQALDKTNQEDLDNILFAASHDAVQSIKRKRPFALSDRFLSIECRRLVRLVREWLEAERDRDDFMVEATEHSHVIQIGELRLQGRLDRVDRLENGMQLIIDYKTSQYKIDAMLGERPDEPQLPLYLVMANPPLIDVAGIAFATIKSGEMGFSALVREDGVLPGVGAFDKTGACGSFANWTALFNHWNAVFLQLASGFMSGDARVMPKNFPETCRYCDFQPFCRVTERLVTTENRDAVNE